MLCYCNETKVFLVSSVRTSVEAAFDRTPQLFAEKANTFCLGKCFSATVLERGWIGIEINNQLCIDHGNGGLGDTDRLLELITLGIVLA